MILALAVFAIALAPAGSSHAEPYMRTIETPLEGTSVLSMRVNRAGRGRIELLCAQCDKGRVRLKITPESSVTLNGAPVPMNLFSPSSRDFMTGFFRQQDGVLTRLIVER